MNTEIFYAASIVASIAGLYLLWVFGYQPLFVDEFRDGLFAVRDHLYAMASDGRIAPDHSAYRSMERLLNGLVRFAHMFNLSFLLVNSFEFSRRGEQADPQDAIFRAIGEVKNPQVQSELQSMEREIRLLVSKQMMRASIPMFVLTRIITPITKKEERRAVTAFEREAYNAPVVESHRGIAAMA